MAQERLIMPYERLIASYTPIEHFPVGIFNLPNNNHCDHTFTFEKLEKRDE